MNDHTEITENLSFDSEPDTQEFIDAFLRALEKQYSYDRLKDLSIDHLEDEVDYLQNDLMILRWRLFRDKKLWRSEAETLQKVASVSRSHSLEKPTIDQIYQISWTINRIERNFDRAWRNSDRGGIRGILSSVKYVFIGSPQFAGVEIDFSENIAADDRPKRMNQ
ncbi:hypothetical protein [Natrinema ejinorense]|uniref:hypothetical protein n=1 Tax=Natrinema ejinorense TaxID=373386 RepID=UPI0011800A1E|nr:hypothetical protein [Natrinema ejinorense]